MQAQVSLDRIHRLGRPRDPATLGIDGTLSAPVGKTFTVYVLQRDDAAPVRSTVWHAVILETFFNYIGAVPNLCMSGDPLASDFFSAIDALWRRSLRVLLDAVAPGNDPYCGAAEGGDALARHWTGGCRTLCVPECLETVEPV